MGQLFNAGATGGRQRMQIDFLLTGTQTELQRHVAEYWALRLHL